MAIDAVWKEMSLLLWISQHEEQNIIQNSDSGKNPWLAMYFWSKAVAGQELLNSYVLGQS